ncbi:MAG: tRNA 5-methoxyuridine(34)/uridine 5-oxyacetic acid(34) synthase CmoB [Gammaproteobacteria bacterium]|nr:tRNA 5-methoxyuridine(34)/uridine 5-oxyacetic acid(34) synthase CmoB [Gammaproteobacteria bacterium]
MSYLVDHPLVRQRLPGWIDRLASFADSRMAAHGQLDQWQLLLGRLPDLVPAETDLVASAVRIGHGRECDDTQHQILLDVLRQLHPWRKGPFSIFGIDIDSEWRSDQKWQRLAPHISGLQGRLVLDVGCGNGYYGWRMLGAGAGLVIGIEPMALFNVQFQAIKHYQPTMPLHVLPLAVEEVPVDLQAFDTVFSMGVLYHRRSPLDHLLELKGMLRSGGELVLETLVIDGGIDQVLLPEGRYAKMRNVWFIPSCLMLERWLLRCGFTAVRIVDVSTTSVSEQRRTEWMHFESLADFLAPGDPLRTLEGYPAPRRAVVIAAAP